MTNLVFGSNNKVENQVVKDQIHLLVNNDVSKLIVKNGKLEKKSLCDRFSYFFSLPKSRKEIDAKVTNNVLDLITKVRDYQLKTQVERSQLRESFDVSPINSTVPLTAKQTIEVLTKQVGKLKVLTAGQISGVFSKEFQNFLSTDLKRLREVKADRKQQGLADSPDARMERTEAKAKLICSLGLGIKDNKGTTGTVLIEYFNKKKIAVFKRSNDHVTWTTHIKNLFKRSFFGQLAYLRKDPMTQPYSEIVSYEFDKRFGIGLAPASKKVTINGQHGALQVFSKGKELASIEDNFNNRSEYTALEIKLFQLMAILDYATGNLDRHSENLLVREKDDDLDGEELENEDEGEIVGMVAIDNANAFPESAPTEFGALFLGNQYKWRTLEIAKIPFSREAVEVVSKMTPDAIRDFIDTTNGNYQGFFNAKMEQQFKNRLEVLRTLVQEHRTPADLGAIRTKSQIQNEIDNAY